MCLNRLGMEDGRIADGQITGSSVYSNTGHHPTNARLSSTGAWSAGANDLTQWIQVDLGQAKMVSGIVLQGRESYNQRVTRYKVQHGNGSATLEFARPANPQFKDELVRYDI